MRDATLSLSQVRPSLSQTLSKALNRLIRRGPIEAARVAWARLRESISSEGALLMMVRDVADGAPAPGDGTGFALRAATVRDGPLYARRVATDSPRTFSARLSPETHCYLVFEGDALLHSSWVTTGAAWTREIGRHIVAPEGDAYVYESFTRPEARGRGVYPFALGAISALLARAGTRRLWVAVEVDNAPSIRAVTKGGFRFSYEVRYRRRWGRVRVLGLTGPGADAGSSMVGDLRSKKS